MKKRSWVNTGYIGLVMAFLYAPIIVMAVFSFNESLIKAKSPRNIFDRIYSRGEIFMRTA